MKLCSFSRKIKKGILLVLLLAGWLIVAGILGVRYFYGNVDIALMIQHSQLIKTANLSLYAWAMVWGGIFILIATLLTLRWKIIGIPVLIIILGYLIIPEIGFNFFVNKNKSLYHQYYTVPKLTAPKKPKNIIWISLESIETLFAKTDATGGEDLIKNLTEFQKNGIHFQGWHYLPSMEPTIPSYVTTNCGIPRNTKISSIRFKRVVGAYPKAVCMTDLLKKNGYNTTFVMGGHIEDENANQFVDTHPFTTVMSRDDFIKQSYSTPEQQITDSNDITPDEIVFKYAKDKITQLSQSDKPFFISIITADTHGPSFKYLEPDCEKKYDDSRDCLKCLDKTVAGFVKWVQKQPFYKDTVVFLIGDHPMFNSNLSRMKWLDPRKAGIQETYNAVLDGSQLTPKIIRKKFTQVDWAPTILESAGFKLSPRKLGLGTSLWGNEPTLLEQYASIKVLDQKLQESEAFFDDFFYKGK